MIPFQRVFITVAVALLCGMSQTQGQIAADNQAAEIENLIEQLVFDHPKSAEMPLLSPGVRANDEEYTRQFEKCQKAFEKLTELKETAFPYLVAHLDDKRPSIPFQGNTIPHLVGNACYWNIYYQLMDQPRGYSFYGHARTGRDGQQHRKPNWDGTLFTEAGGLKAWLEKNKNLSYAEKQILCLNWRLSEEKVIGAPDAQSYFRDILPLEIRILERKLETGADVQRELDHLRSVLKEKLVNEVPAELLPAKLLAESPRPNNRIAIALSALCVAGGMLLVVAIWWKWHRAV